MRTTRVRRHAVLASALLILILAGCAFVNVPLISRPQPLEEKVVDGEGEDKILLLEVTGPISEEKQQIGRAHV